MLALDTLHILTQTLLEPPCSYAQMVRWSSALQRAELTFNRAELACMFLVARRPLNTQDDG